MSKQYTVLRRLGERGGARQWHPGEVIELDDERAAVLLRRKVIEAVSEPPASPKPAKTKAIKVEVTAAPDPAPIMEDNEHGTPGNPESDL